MTKIISEEDFTVAKVGNFEVAFVWASKLNKLIKQRNELLESNARLKIENVRLEEELEGLKRTMETSTFVRLYG